MNHFSRLVSFQGASQPENQEVFHSYGFSIPLSELAKISAESQVSHTLIALLFKRGDKPRGEGGEGYSHVENTGILVGKKLKLNPTKRPMSTWFELYFILERYHLKFDTTTFFFVQYFLESNPNSGVSF